MGNGVTSIDIDAFNDCSGLTSVYYSGAIAEWCGIEFADDGGNPLGNAHNLYINDNLVTDFIIPDTVTEIKDYAFYGASCITSVTIPHSVSSIGRRAFQNCSGMTGTLTIPNSVTSIDSYAFRGCSSLTSVTIPNSVTSISYYAFGDCSGLTSVIIPNSVTSIGSCAFSGCSGLTEVTIPNSVTSIGMGAFSGCSGLTEVTIPNSVTSIGIGAFYGCSALTSVTIPNSVTSIGGGAFEDCSGLATVNFDATNCTSMGSTSGGPIQPVFGGCTSLTTLNIGENVTQIPSYAFLGCSELTIITIPNSITSIGNSAFSGCSGLTTFDFNAENCTGTISDFLFDSNNTLSKITIGENVTTIPNNAFKNCTSLDSIICAAANPPVIYAGTFDSQLSLNTPVVVPCGAVEDYEDADFWYGFRHIQQMADCGASYMITVLSANPSRGTVEGGGTYPEGMVVRIEATAFDGFYFASWNDGNTDNPRYITVTADAMFIASFDPATGIGENVVSGINIFLNPAADILNITSSETISEIEIVNVMGQVVKRIEVNSDNVVCNVEDLISGVYVVKVRALRQAQGATLQKFIKE